ncbi:hypothetical protein EDD16DRAFT_1522355 [Pisolithus croceorrhizus]|nr:hypothetical protein EDD16DRAFT_1522355 [Pisolithus croceorrhizus]KAI6119642.1 hypothetical protein EV401DRAFT_1888115 [Pisolithus croceorrhizus]KAI6160183.1 hypothetical protein EDD17DRAFT_1510729 [Pisolithus thermaeus]
MMLSILEFLASPWEIPGIEIASTNVLGARDPNAVLSEQDCQCLLNSMGKVACAALQEPHHAPMSPVLESFNTDSLLASWNDMVISTTKALVNTILPTISEDNVTRPVLTNLMCKLQWVKLGLHPTKEPVIKSDTPSPLFTDLSMMTMLGNWNTMKISLCKCDAAGQDINFGPALAEPSMGLSDNGHASWVQWECFWITISTSRIPEDSKHVSTSHCIALTAVRVAVAKLIGGDWEKCQKKHLQGLFEPVGDTKWLDASTTFMKVYHSELAGTAPTLARARASNIIFNTALDGCVSEERKSYFKEVYKIL